MAQGHRPPVDVHLLLVQAQRSDHRQRLHRERLVQLDQIEVVDRDLHLGAQLSHGLDRTQPHELRLYPRHGRGHNARPWPPSQRLRQRLLSDQGRGRAVGDPGGVARGDAPVCSEGWLQLGQRLQGGVPGVLVCRQRLAVAARYGHNFIPEAPALDRRPRPLLAAERKRVHVLPADAGAGGNFLGRQAHPHPGEGAAQPLVHHRIGQANTAELVAPAHLVKVERRVAHALRSAGQVEVSLPQQHPLPRHIERPQPGGADHVDGRTAYRDRQARSHRRHPGDVRPGPPLNRVAEDDLVHPVLGDRVPLQ